MVVPIVPKFRTLSVIYMLIYEENEVCFIYFNYSAVLLCVLTDRVLNFGNMGNHYAHKRYAVDQPFTNLILRAKCIVVRWLMYIECMMALNYWPARLLALLAFVLLTSIRATYTAVLVRC